MTVFDSVRERFDGWTCVEAAWKKLRVATASEKLSIDAKFCDQLVCDLPESLCLWAFGISHYSWSAYIGICADLRVERNVSK